MFRRTATAAALTAAGLVAASPLALAGTSDPTPKDPIDHQGPSGSGNVQLLNGLSVLPVQACGASVPILSGILDAPKPECGVENAGSPVHGN